ncbi:MAG: TIGR00282 family metallophosphoesterase [Chloroflexi bacterium]|nr:TIGR00282 family metallophosphoesterase [Chloroflexota bacterium]
MRILMIGDIIGKPGRKGVQALLPFLRQEHEVDLVVANGENAAGGLGLTLATAEELFQAGVDVITSGNHIWDQKDIILHLDSEIPVLRPLNYPPGVPGRGYLRYGKALVVSLLGRTFMGNFDCPFRAMDSLLAQLAPLPPVIIVDIHAEATSEKMALGWYLDGRVSAVLGTHTHVATADARLLARGTAYVTDVGMVGPYNSVIGDDMETVLRRFLTQMPYRITVGRGSILFNSVLINIDETTGHARDITRLDQKVAPNG